ncbi:MAG: nucleotidyltransferase domain-containing protein [Parachlamydiaceae bacterium]|nr:nucleotidyltransferase domain-containing protein [Parachlamydiaceae bacterium]
MDLLHKKQLQIAIDMLLRNIPDLFAIVLFGSYGHEYETSQSDLDLAFLSKSKQDVVYLWELAQNIAIELNRDVDLIDLRSSSTVFRFQILSSGKLIYCSNQKDFDFFENTTFAMYLNFQETRKEILNDYKERKSHRG